VADENGRRSRVDQKLLEFVRLAFVTLDENTKALNKTNRLIESITEQVEQSKKN